MLGFPLISHLVSVGVEIGPGFFALLVFLWALGSVGVAVRGVEWCLFFSTAPGISLAAPALERGEIQLLCKLTCDNLCFFDLWLQGSSFSRHLFGFPVNSKSFNLCQILVVTSLPPNSPKVSKDHDEALFSLEETCQMFKTWLASHPWLFKKVEIS